jgi:hypothetical protein
VRAAAPRVGAALVVSGDRYRRARARRRRAGAGFAALGSGFERTFCKQSLWANLEISSLQAAIDFENRNQLLAGYTGNLDEAIAAFREKRKPVYGE